MLLFITILAFFTVFSLCMLIYHRVMADKQLMRQRFGYFVEEGLGATVLTDSAAAVNNQDATFRSWLRGMGKYVDSPQWSRLLEHKLTQAGIPLRSSEYAVIVVSTLLLFALLFFLLSEGNLIMAAIGGAMGYLIPILFLRMKIQQRAKQFNNQLGDTLILIANALRTGYSFMQAIEMVSREMPPPIATEYARALKEMNLGISTEEALNNMAKRVDSEDLDLVITVVLIQRQVGGNLAEILDNIAGTIRERVKLRGQIKTLTAQGRISGFVVGGMPFILVIILYIINPAYMGLMFSTPLGKLMLAGALMGQLFGALAIRKIINIDI